MKLIEGNFGGRAPDDLAANLRELAEAVDRDEITSFVAAYVDNDNYSFMFGASLKDAIVLTELLQVKNIERMRE